MKTAIATDSSSGITQEQAREIGVYVVPMPFMIDGVDYEEGVDLSVEDFYKKMNAGASISTSQASPARILELWNRLLDQEEFDEIVYVPLSSGLSSTCQTATVLAADFGGRVQVVNNQRVSVTQRQSVLDALELARRGMTAKEIRELLERTKFDSTIYITVDTLKYLRQGGRITPAAAALGTLLRIKPVLQILGEKLDSFSKARTMKQAKSIMLSALASDLDVRLHDPEAEHSWLCVAHTQNEEMALEFAQEIRALYPKTHEIVVNPLALNIACHIGPGSLAVTCAKSVTDPV